MHDEFPPADRRPSGAPGAIRYFVCYHDGDQRSCEFFELERFAIETKRFVHDLEGDIVWTIGKLRYRDEYYLDSRFRVETVHPTIGESGRSAYEVAAKDGFVFVPECRVTRRPWFRHYKHDMQGLSHGFQRIKDPVVLAGLAEEYRLAQAFLADADALANAQFDRVRRRTPQAQDLPIAVHATNITISPRQAR